MKEAIYILGNNTFDILIPKKRGEGFLKSCFGWHSANDKCLLFDEIKPKECGDTCDIDGYLQIDFKINSWDKGYKEAVNNTCAALKQCFPYIDEFIEDDKRFWEILGVK